MNLIIDLSILIHANYYVIKKYATTVNAVGLANKVVNQVDNLIIHFQKEGHSVDNVVCVADHKKNFRKALYSDYKAGRPDRLELKKITNQVLAFVASKLDLIQYKGLEADDIIYLYTRKHKPCIIVTNDNDLLQCIDSEGIQVYLYQKQELLKTGTLETTPEYIILQKCLLGDKSDNIQRSVLDSRITKTKIEKIFWRLGKQASNKTILKEIANYNVRIDKKLFKLNRLLIEFNVDTYKKYIKGFSKFYSKL